MCSILILRQGGMAVALTKVAQWRRVSVHASMRIKMMTESTTEKESGAIQNLKLFLQLISMSGTAQEMFKLLLQWSPHVRATDVRSTPM